MTDPLAAALDFALTSFDRSPTPADERRSALLGEKGWPAYLAAERSPAYLAARAEADARAIRDRAARRAVKLAQKRAAR